MCAQKLIVIGSLRTSIGIIDEEAMIFLAQGITEQEFTDKTHEIEKVEKFPFRDALNMIKENKINDGLTVGAILKVNQLLTH